MRVEITWQEKALNDIYRIRTAIMLNTDFEHAIEEVKKQARQRNCLLRIDEVKDLDNPEVKT